MADIPVTDYFISYTATGGEIVFDVDWRVDALGDLTVERTRGGVKTTLLNLTDYSVAQLGDIRGALVMLSGPAMSADLYEITGIEPLSTSNQTQPVYVLARWRGAWLITNQYVIGDAVENVGASYVAIVDHASQSSDNPGVGAGWQLKWDLVASKGDDGPPSTVADNAVTIEKLHQSIADVIADAAPLNIAFARGWTDWIANPSLTGALATDLYSGPEGQFDRGNVLRVVLASGSLNNVTERQMLDGANVCAVQNSSGDWEVLQFQTATLVSGTTYDLSKLLRGQGGTGAEMRDPVATSALVVFK